MNILKNILYWAYYVVSSTINAALYAAVALIAYGFYSGHILAGCNKVGCIFSILP